MNYYQSEPYIADALAHISAWPYETDGEFVAALNDQARMMSHHSLDLCPDCAAADLAGLDPA